MAVLAGGLACTAAGMFPSRSLLLLPVAALTGLIVLAPLPRGPLSREIAETSWLVRSVAWLLGIGFIGLSIRAGIAGSILTALSGTACLAGAVLVVVLGLFRSRRVVTDLALSMIFLPGAILLLLTGVGFVATGSVPGGLGFLAGGTVCVLLGTAVLRRKTTLPGIALLLSGIPFPVLVLIFFPGGVLFGIGLLLGSVALVLTGAALLGGGPDLRQGSALLGMAGLVGGTAFLVFGNEALQNASVAPGIVMLLSGAAVIQRGIAVQVKVLRFLDAV